MRTDWVQVGREARGLTVWEIKKRGFFRHFDRALRDDTWMWPNSDAPSRVYFARDVATGAVKIGTSTCVPRRLRALGKKVELIATVRGGYQVEALLLQLFAHARIRGEWFHPVPELLEHIEEMKVLA
jgi:hypothetical protein